uniref:SEA domain-containing protein n=1 Tax=Magallana gigas TaxID=29159 RepID=A0A8W8IRX1_MAGGI
MSRDCIYPPKESKPKNHLDVNERERKNNEMRKSMAGPAYGVPVYPMNAARTGSRLGATREPQHYDDSNSFSDGHFGRDTYLGKSSKRDIEETILYNANSNDFDEVGSQHVWPGENVGDHRDWMDKILGGTFQRNYLDRNSFRASLRLDTKSPIQHMGFVSESDGNSLDSSYADPTITRRTIFCILGGILLILLTVVPVVVFIIIKDDDTTTTYNTYYVADSQISVNQSYQQSYSNSSSLEFKNFSETFCTEMRTVIERSFVGDEFRQCNVKELLNGSVIVIFQITFIASEKQITKDNLIIWINTEIRNGVNSTEDDVFISNSGSGSDKSNNRNDNPYNRGDFRDDKSHNENNFPRNDDNSTNRFEYSNIRVDKSNTKYNN